jgi:hypothetical protein
MSPRLLLAEHELTEQAVLESDEHVRNLTGLIEKASGPNPSINATDCSRLVSSALAVNERLRERAKALASELEKLRIRAESAARESASQRG